MPIDYTTQGAIRGDSTFRSRVTQAVTDAALAISGELQGVSTAEEWAARQALAHQMLAGADPAQRFTGPVLADIGPGSTATDQTGISDGEIDTAVSAVWNDIAGIAAT